MERRRRRRRAGGTWTRRRTAGDAWTRMRTAGGARMRSRLAHDLAGEPRPVSGGGERRPQGKQGGLLYNLWKIYKLYIKPIKSKLALTF